MNEIFKLFEDIDHESWSGEIEFKSSQGFATVRVFQGRFIWAHRPVDRAAERLARISWIKMPPPNAIEGISEWSVFVERMIAFNPENYERLIKLLKMDRLKVFFRIFFWNNIEIIKNPKPGLTQPIGHLEFYSTRSFDKLLGEAQLRQTEWPKLKQRIGSSKRVFISQIQVEALQKNLQKKAAKQKESTTSPYSAEELDILQNCNGRNSVQDLVKNLPYGEYLVVRHLLDLWKRGAVRSKDEEGAAVSLVYEREGLSALDIVGAGWSALFVGLLYWVINLGVHTESAISCQSAPVSQALEIYRLQKQHYPLTLRELPTDNLPPGAFNPFNYTLSNPVSYEITCRQTVLK